jgi:hypothetical protein
MDAFLVYLLSHIRPMAEAPDPHRKDITEEFARNFAGMTQSRLEIADLVQAREDVISGIHGALTEADRQFLLAAQWKLMKLARLPEERRQALADRLKGMLGL